MGTAIVPGSFDPVTLGHIDLIERASRLFDKVIVVAMINETKEYLFSMDERVELLKSATAHISNLTVDKWQGMLWEYGKNVNATAIVKGVRSEADTKYELEMAKFNKEMLPTADTVLLPAIGEFVNISSTEAKRKAFMGEELYSILPAVVVDKLLKRYKGE